MSETQTKRTRKTAATAETPQQATAETTPEQLLAIVQETLESHETAYITQFGHVQIDR
jgi:hypothetical protein